MNWKVIAASFFLIASRSESQGVPRTVIPDSLRAILTARFDKAAENPYSVEYMYCVGIKQAHLMDGTPVYFVTSLTDQPDTDHSATP